MTPCSPNMNFAPSSYAYYSTLTVNYLAFSAVLLILGILLICRMTGQLAAGVVDKIRVYPFRAVKALFELDIGNRMIDRC